MYKIKLSLFILLEIYVINKKFKDKVTLILVFSACVVNTIKFYVGTRIHTILLQQARRNQLF